MTMFRSSLAVVLSFLLTFIVVINAFANKKQFYPSVVYLTKSNSSMAVIYFQAFVFALLIGKLMNKIFFGELRAIEMEHLFERSWYVITETCLAFTVFRDDFSPKFVTMFTLLLFLKCFHWLSEDRVDFMERSPVITLLFHMRIIGLLSLLLILDMNFVHTAYTHTLVKGASVQLVFGFEYAILFVTVISTFFKYLLHSIDLQNDNPWENKGIFMLYGELVLGFFRVVLYLTFMSLMIKIHTFPLFAIRPMYLSLRTFKKAFNDVVMSRRAIQNLNIMYPDVSQEQLAAYSDTICIICREEMSNSSEDGNQSNAAPQQIKKLPCDHIFHKSCLRSWFQRQQTCPTCRTPILRLNQQPTTAPAGQAAGPVPAPAAANVPLTPSAAQSQANMNQHAAHVQHMTAHFHQHHQHVPPFASASNIFLPQPPPLYFNTANMPLPPFAFMPPPLPPLNLSPGLTLEELAEMEGNERHNIEARIHCLRNINTLLTASMLNIQQYMNICSANSHLENITQTRNKSGSVENDLKQMNQANESVETSSDLKADTESKSQELHQKIETLHSRIDELNKKSDALVAEVTSTPRAGTSNSDMFDEAFQNNFEDVETVGGGEESDEIRRRRLQHFSTANN